MKLRYILILFSMLAFSNVTLADTVSPTEIPVQQPPVPAVENLAGTEMRLLPANIDVWACDWAPNGKTLVFSGKTQGEVASKMRIWYWSLDPINEPVPLTATEGLIDYSPRWSPDGTKIVLSRRSFNKTDNSNNNASLWLKEIPGGAGRKLTNGTQDRDPVWSPDGTKLIFSRSNGPYNAQLLVVDLNGGTVKQLCGKEGEVLISPWWGSDGKIYFAKLTPYPKPVTVSGQSYQVMEFGNGGIWAVNPENKLMEPVVVDEYDNRLPILSPDGTKLAFVSSRNPTKDGNGKYDRGSLYIRDMATGEIKYITNKVGLNGGSLSWSPDGKKLAFFTFRSIRPAVWVISI